jgi:uncharacterized protein YjiS (DUF1127 family)
MEDPMATLSIQPAKFRAAQGSGRAPRLARALGWFGRVLRRWGETVRVGRYLAEMDDHMLKDLGVSRAQAQFMASRPLLRAWWRG